MKEHFIATTTFGVEAVVRRELEDLGHENTETENGRVSFFGDMEDMAEANLWLRSAERVQWCVRELGNVTDFDQLFDAVYSVDWQDIIPKDGEMHVVGKSHRSQLSSVPACQSITKKAIIKKMQTKHKQNTFPETGPLYRIQVALLNNRLTLTIDTTGDGLFQRGYREGSLIAPIKETLAAAMIQLSFWDKHRIFLDPLCGSGTIPIEAAFIAKNIAPGLNRKFVAETWPHLDKSIFKNKRKEAYQAIDHDFKPQIYASDRSTDAMKQARYNAREAGVDEDIQFKQVDLADLELPGDFGVLITNPPYGERMGTTQDVKELYRQMGSVFGNEKTWSKYIITAAEDFELYYGRNANQKRKLYNGRIKTDFYQYHGERPPKSHYPDDWFASYDD